MLEELPSPDPGGAEVLSTRSNPRSGLPFASLRIAAFRLVGENRV